jgi:hypothetical protein
MRTGAAASGQIPACRPLHGLYVQLRRWRAGSGQSALARAKEDWSHGSAVFRTEPELELATTNLPVRHRGAPPKRTRSPSRVAPVDSASPWTSRVLLTKRRTLISTVEGCHFGTFSLHTLRPEEICTLALARHDVVLNLVTVLVIVYPKESLPNAAGPRPGTQRPLLALGVSLFPLLRRLFLTCALIIRLDPVDDRDGRLGISERLMFIPVDGRQRLPDGCLSRLYLEVQEAPRQDPVRDRIRVVRPCRCC